MSETFRVLAILLRAFATLRKPVIRRPGESRSTYTSRPVSHIPANEHATRFVSRTTVPNWG
jgi:hypothetical protein